MNTRDLVPVVLFAYARPDHLRQTLSALQADCIPALYVFSDAPHTPAQAPAVAEVREILRSIDWCSVTLTERSQNLGLGRSIRAGVAEVLAIHDAVIVCEDDLVFVPGSYAYLAAALEHYRNNIRVMSVTGWTHPRVIPGDVTDQPYFDGRAECLLWGTWARSWEGMERSAREMMRACRARGIDVYRYGADLPEMAETELARNVWAVRFLYLHLLQGGLCLRPPYSLVEHIGFDSLATNAAHDTQWSNPPLRPCPPIPGNWPVPAENSACPLLWRKAFGARPSLVRRATRIARRMARVLVTRYLLSKPQ